MTGYRGRISYPASMILLANEFGEMRDEANKVLMSLRHDYDSSHVRKEISPAALGVLGELIARHHLFGLGVKFSASPLVTLNRMPAKMPDIEIELHRFDIKTIREEHPWLIVDKDRLAKSRGDITHYWFIHLVGRDEADMYVYAHNEVAEWPTTQIGYGVCHFKPAQPTHEGVLSWLK